MKAGELWVMVGQLGDGGVAELYGCGEPLGGSLVISDERGHRPWDDGVMSMG